MAKKLLKGAGISRPEGNIFLDREAFGISRDLFSQYLDQGGDQIPLNERMEVTLQVSYCKMIWGSVGDAERRLNECEEYILQYGKEEEKGCVYNLRCRLNILNTKYDEAITAGLKALHIFQQIEFPFFTKDTLTCCGVLCEKMGLNTEAIDYLSQANTVALQMGNERESIICTANLNDALINMLPVDECIDAGQKLMERIHIEYAGKPCVGEAGTYLQLAHLYFKKGDLALADRYADNCKEVMDQMNFPEEHLLYVNYHSVKADIAGAYDDEEQVLGHTHRIKHIALKARHKAALVASLFFLSEFYLRRKDMAKAKAYLDEAASMIPESDRSEQYLDLNEYKCKYYKASGDVASEYEHFKLIYEYRLKVQQETLSNRARYMATMHELELRRKEIAHHKAELDHKTQELNLSTYYLQQRDNLLIELKKDIDEQKRTDPGSGLYFKRILKTIERAFVREKEENARIREKFDEAHRTFIIHLYSLYPTLTPTECRICALLKSGFNSKEIASVLSTHVRNIENHRVRIRRKLGLGVKDNLNMKLTEIVW
ncbi:MAG: hypothetical protein JWO03_3952 [Bacteroidetes bacterium]|nr:hypothetical protein [Bacteroidota bacterium]